jgi:hypothetical protein
VLNIAGFGGTPAAGNTVEVWALPYDIDGTTDDTNAPSGTAAGGGRYLGKVDIAASSSGQVHTVDVFVGGFAAASALLEIYLFNRTSQTLTGSGTTVKMTPFTYGITA